MEDKTFIKNILNDVRHIQSIPEYYTYLRSGITEIINAELLSHIIDYNVMSKVSCFLLYKYNQYYIFLEIPKHITTNFVSTIEDAIEHAYVTTSRWQIENHYRDQLSYESQHWSDLYFVHKLQCC